MSKVHNLFEKSWVFSTYFAQGLPYSLFAVIPSIMFRDNGVNLSVIGFLSLLNIPWVIKFLWAPFVDSNSTLKKWIYSTELGITFVISLLALSLLFDEFGIVVVLLLAGTFISATHDIAVDGFYMTSLDDDIQKKQIGFRVMAYRIALAFGSGIIISTGTAFSWKCAYGTAAVCMLVLYLFHKFFLPEKKHKRIQLEKLKTFKTAFSTYFKHDKISYIIVFIAFFRAGEYMLGLMRGPFMVDIGIKLHIGWITGGVAIPASILGAICGGYIISRYGLIKTGVPVIIFQNCTNLLYAALAFYFYDSVIINNYKDILVVALVNGIESFSSGIGTALLMIFLIKICNEKFKAAHYAIGSGIMAINGAVINSLGGILAEYTGYGWFFVVSFIVAMPALFVFKELSSEC